MSYRLPHVRHCVLRELRSIDPNQLGTLLGFPLPNLPLQVVGHVEAIQGHPFTRLAVDTVDGFERLWFRFDADLLTSLPDHRFAGGFSHLDMTGYEAVPPIPMAGVLPLE